MREWRGPTWALVVWSGFFAVVSAWGFGKVITGSTDPYDAGHALGQLFWIWFIGFVVIGFAWRQTRPSLKSCPRCGLTLPKSAQWCTRCGYYPGMPAGPIAGPGMPNHPGYPPQPPIYAGYQPGRQAPQQTAQPSPPIATTVGQTLPGGSTSPTTPDSEPSGPSGSAPTA
jgi:hypothetical protein